MLDGKTATHVSREQVKGQVFCSVNAVQNNETMYFPLDDAL